MRPRSTATLGDRLTIRAQNLVDCIGELISRAFQSFPIFSFPFIFFSTNPFLDERDSARRAADPFEPISTSVLVDPAFLTNRIYLPHLPLSRPAWWPAHASTIDFCYLSLIIFARRRVRNALGNYIWGI